MIPEPGTSLGPLALLAMREAGADGYALYRNGHDGGVECFSSGGFLLPEQNPDDQLVVRIPLRVVDIQAGVACFLFQGKAIREDQQAVLERAARTIENVWSLSGTSERVLALAIRISRLQAEVADLKIADRTRGFLERAVPNATEIMAEHVAEVSRAHRLEALLEQKVRELEIQLSERRLVSEANSLLRSSYGLSEEQAYGRLRLTSRRSRQRLGEVARRFLETARQKKQA